MYLPSFVSVTDFIVNFTAEGTTTNGDFLLPFKTGAFLARVPVLPVILRYPYQRFSLAWDSISGVCLFRTTCTYMGYHNLI